MTALDMAVDDRAAAARAGAQVTRIELADNLVRQAHERAKAAGLTIRFDQGDAEDLPYETGSFDLVVSLIGAMFALRPERVAAELVRVCKPGGRIVMANWTPEGFVDQLFKTIGNHAPRRRSCRHRRSGATRRQSASG
jgi:ubiquinone/menaquinone biosynthesis C-methylase UbiE